MRRSKDHGTKFDPRLELFLAQLPFLVLDVLDAVAIADVVFSSQRPAVQQQQQQQHQHHHGDDNASPNDSITLLRLWPTDVMIMMMMRVSVGLSSLLVLVPRIWVFVDGCQRKQFVGNGGLGFLLLLLLCEWIAMMLLDVPFWIYCAFLCFHDGTSAMSPTGRSENDTFTKTFPVYFWIVHPLRVVLGCVPCYLMLYRQRRMRLDEEEG